MLGIRRVTQRAIRCATRHALRASLLLTRLGVAPAESSLSLERQCAAWGCGTDTSLRALGSGRCKCQSDSQHCN